MTGMYQSGNIVSQGTINLGTRGSRTFVQGHIFSGHPVTSPQLVCNPAKKLYSSYQNKRLVQWKDKKTGIQEEITEKFALSWAHFSL